ncbi:MAG: hypothetical protein HC813_00335 [Planctomycetes bacterium]|nr:hypothetical protein [Planctomycetota bacterium]
MIVLHDDANRFLRWSRVSDDELSVFLTNPLSGEIRLLVRGEVATVTSGRNGRSLFSLLALTGPVVPLRREAQFFQQDEVRIEVDGLPGWQEEPPTASRFDRARLVASRVQSTPEPSRPVLGLTVRANRPRVDGSILTMLAWSDEQWQLESVLHLQVQQGA